MMHVLLIGGSGHVAKLITPMLLEKHSLRIFDLMPPEDKSLEYIQGNVTDHEALTKALKGMDALIYLAMGSLDWDEWPGTNSGFDANVKGLHFALKAAAKEGIRQAVYCSSMSVYANLLSRYFPDEDITPDETALYGFSKWLGEEVCKNAWRRWGMNINALRLCHPTAKEKWLAETKAGTPTIATADEDVARAMLAALEFKGGFQAFMISGDFEQKYMNMAKAKQLLGWMPLARPLEQG
jgi:nucleoside-diphosphate-sugar epimerase